MHKALLGLALLLAAGCGGDSGSGTYEVQSCNMAPTLQRGDHLEVVRPPGRLRRGDIVVFERPGDELLVISRIVAVGDDRVEVRDERLLVNDAPADDRSTPPSPTSTVVPADRYFMVGDNRANSADSRFFGPVPADAVKAKVTKVVPGDGSCDE